MDDPNRHALILAHLGLARSAALRFRRRARWAGLEPEDLMGEGSLALVLAARDCPAGSAGDFGSFAGWRVVRAVYSATRRSYLRGGPHLHRGPLPADIEDDSEPTGAQAEREEARLAVAAALAALPPAERLVACLRMVEGLTRQQVAHRYREDEAWVERQSRWAIGRLRVKLAEWA